MLTEVVLKQYIAICNKVRRIQLQQGKKFGLLVHSNMMKASAQDRMKVCLQSSPLPPPSALSFIPFKLQLTLL